MAVAAYASVLSLLRVIDNIQHPSRLRFFADTTQIGALKEKLCFLQDFFEVHSSIISQGIECMARIILDVTHDAESLIDNYVVDRVYGESDEDFQNDVMAWYMESFFNAINRLGQDIEHINQSLMMMRTIQHDQEQVRISVPSLISSGDKNALVGLDDQLEQVMNKLLCNRRNLEVVPIVGMGGIGKTTLSRSAFDHPYNVHHFQMRIWLTISQDYSVEKILQGLLQDGILGDRKDAEWDESESIELMTQLHKKLFGQRYLIVLDDVWSEEVWNDLKWGFPNNDNGSRVMVTTRLSQVASSLDSRNNTYSMKFLDEDKSWDLFSTKAFEQGGRSLELENIGREISKRCKGLPLLLVLIGGLLANSNKTAEYWQKVSKDLYSFANSVHDEYCLRILSLSYRHLPLHLKQCFLHMRHFREDSHVDVSLLVETWVIKGFVKPVRGKNLEEAARQYLEDLVGRNMLFIRDRGKYGNIKTIGIHDLLRDLCIKESNKEQFLEFPKFLSISSYYEQACLLCGGRIDTTMFYAGILSSEATRYGKITVCSSCKSKYPKIAGSRFVEAVKINSKNFPVMTKCRSLEIESFWVSFDVLSTIRLLWNLQTLCIDEYLGGVLACRLFVMPKEFWEMPQLRHVRINGFMLPDPASTTNDDAVILENLQTLTTVVQFKFTDEVFTRIPHLRKLGLCYDPFSADEEEDWTCFCLQNLARLQKLESLSLRCRMDCMETLEDIGFPCSMDSKVIDFPCSLKKLTLQGCNISWDDLTIIGSLPNLQVLKLLSHSVLGNEWILVEGGFDKLKYLKLKSLHLVDWTVDEAHFPALEALVLNRMEALETIPREIGELSSLSLIYLKFCTENTVDSAKEIVEEQMTCGNEGLVVRVKDGLWKTYQIGGTNV